jgi:hypothetical protein
MPRVYHAFRLIPSLTDPDDLYSGESPFIARGVVVYAPPVAAARRTCANAVQNSLAVSNLNVNGCTELPSDGVQEHLEMDQRGERAVPKTVFRKSGRFAVERGRFRQGLRSNP